tara:strand:- start:1022 stop:1459 length:438 start_codon:yes stop_codon:yes gene_type:complete
VFNDLVIRKKKTRPLEKIKNTERWEEVDNAFAVKKCQNNTFKYFLLSMMSSPQVRPSPVGPMPYWRLVEHPLVLWPLPVGCLDNIVLFCEDKYEHVKIRKVFFSFTGSVFFYAMRQKNQPNWRTKGYTTPYTFKYFPQNEYYLFR